MTAPVRLKAHSGLLRRLGELRPMTHAHQAVSPWSLMFLVVASVVAAGASFCVVGYQLPPENSELAYVVAVLVLILPTVIWLTIRVTTAAWWLSGAGHPTLELAAGELRARVRPVFTDDPADDPWWDVRVPIDDVVAVRIVKHRTGPGLVVELPPEVEGSLWTLTDAAATLRQNERLTGSPAVWWLIWYFPLRGRRTQVNQLLTALESAGAPVVR